ncbi:MAG: tRNA (adenosine(37)-N6)-threonylcarbamoyltransferase complex ATPase subunit type 1 TsaE [Halothiobacillaceae bacterium]
MLTVDLPDEAATQALGSVLAHTAPRSGWVALHGHLGAGKTTLVRAFLRALGYQGRVVSPTYTLVEPYEIGGRRIAHYDLYRLADAEELEWMGAREDFGADTLCLVEWPERGEGVLPAPDLAICLEHLPPGRRCFLEGMRPAGATWLAQVENRLKEWSLSHS